MKGAAACDGTDCPGGCCVGGYNWFCCTDGQYCAATEDDCPAPKMMKLASMKAKSKKVHFFKVEFHYHFIFRL